MNTIRIILLFAVLLVVGCGHKAEKPEKFYALSESGISDLQIRVNGEPADGGGMVSLFITNGPNQIKLRGDLLDDSVTIYFGTMTNPFGQSWHSLWEVKGAVVEATTNIGFQFGGNNASEARAIVGGTNREFAYTFDANVPWKWSWEEADVFGVLTELDKQEIMKLFDGMVANITNVQAGVEAFMNKEVAMPWSADPKKIAATKTRFAKMLKEVRAYKDVTFDRAAQGTLIFEPGNKIVALTCESGELYYFGHSQDFEPPDGQMNFTFKARALYFARFEGRWKMLVVTE